MSSYEPKSHPRTSRPRLRVLWGVRSIAEARLHVGLTAGFFLFVGLFQLTDLLRHPLWSGVIAFVLISTSAVLHFRPSLATPFLALFVAVVLTILAARPLFWPLPVGLDSSEEVTIRMLRNEAFLYSLFIAASSAHLVYLARRFPGFHQHAPE